MLYGKALEPIFATEFSFQLNRIGMKKVLLTLVTVCSFALATQAQDIRLGLRGGVNSANIGGEDATSANDFKIGPVVGALASMPIADGVYLEPELNFSIQGTRIYGGGTTIKSRLNYINLPIMGRVELTGPLSMTFGPQVGYLLSASGITKNDDGKGKVDAIDGYNRLDVSIGLGATYLLEENLHLGVRYNYGLTRVNEPIETIDGEEEVNTYNRVLQFTATYFLDL